MRDWKRSLQFSLRGLLALVAIIAGLLGAYANVVHRQYATVEAILHAGGNVVYSPFRDQIDADHPSHFWLDFKDAPTSISLSCRAGDDLCRRIASLQTVTWLDAAGADLTDVGLSHLAELRRLETLMLSDNRRLTELGIGSLRNLPSLENLVLKRVRLSDGAVQRLAGFKNLRFLVLKGAMIEDQAMRHLRTELPDCMIVAPNGEWLVPPSRRGSRPTRERQAP